MERTIKVTGKGIIKLKPDTIRLIITQSSIEKTYEGAITKSSEEKSNLGEALKKSGFEKDALKTLYFNVDTEYESYQAKDKSWKRRLRGYRFTHRMKLEFPADNKILGSVLYVVAHCKGEPEFTIQYTISDPEKAKNELLSKAVEDSKFKAEVLSRAAGVSLKDILIIDYSWGEIDFVSSPVNDQMLCLYSAASELEPRDARIDFDIDADDIEVTDTVTVVWAIG